MSVDSYLSRTPPVKTAVIHLMNEDVSKDDIEYQQFLAKLKPVLESKGYRLTSPAAVILRLKFGVKKMAAQVSEAVSARQKPLTRLTSRKFADNNVRSSPHL